MHLELIIGPMYSGKSTELVRRCSRYDAIGKHVQIVNHSLDSRCSEHSVRTHRGAEYPAVKLQQLKDSFEFLPDVIGIDEAQFFPDLYEFILSIDDSDTIVIVSGLDGDFRRLPFGDILRCIPLCDSVTKLNAMCALCSNGTPGIFTKRLTHDQALVCVGAQDSYSAVCRKHYATIPSSDCHTNDT